MIRMRKLTYPRTPKLFIYYSAISYFDLPKFGQNLAAEAATLRKCVKNQFCNSVTFAITSLTRRSNCKRIFILNVKDAVKCNNRIISFTIMNKICFTMITP